MKRLFLGVFSEEKKEIKLVPTSDIISVSQTVKGFEPTVVAKDDVIPLVVVSRIESGLFETSEDACRSIW